MAPRGDTVDSAVSWNFPRGIFNVPSGRPAVICWFCGSAAPVVVGDDILATVLNRYQASSGSTSIDAMERHHQIASTWGGKVVRVRLGPIRPITELSAIDVQRVRVVHTDVNVANRGTWVGSEALPRWRRGCSRDDLPGCGADRGGALRSARANRARSDGSLRGDPGQQRLRVSPVGREDDRVDR